MATTYNLQSTVSWAAPLLRFAPQQTGSMEPALSNANLVKQTILGAPFAWRQNRTTFEMRVQLGIQGYWLAVPDFGFLEGASLFNPLVNADAPVGAQLQLASWLAQSNETARPASLAVQGDDNNGNCLFMFNTFPDANYLALVDYQRKPVPMTSLASLWDPLPDEYAYIYNWGYLALAALYAGDPRYVEFNQRFIAHLLGAQDGISDLARNIFLANWTAVQAQTQRSQAQTGAAAMARGRY